MATHHARGAHNIVWSHPKYCHTPTAAARCQRESRNLLPEISVDNGTRPLLTTLATGHNNLTQPTYRVICAHLASIVIDASQQLVLV